MLKTSSQTVRTHVCCSQMKVGNLQEKQKKKGIYILSAREASFDLRSSNPVLKREARRLCGSDGLENLKCLFFLSCITKAEVHSCSDRILGFLHLWILSRRYWSIAVKHEKSTRNISASFVLQQLKVKHLWSDRREMSFEMFRVDCVAEGAELGPRQQRREKQGQRKWKSDKREDG